MSVSEDQRLKELYEFGPFRVDPEKEILLRAGQPVPLTPKTFQILLVLVRHRKEVVTKDDLMKSVWPDTFVEEANLSRNIFMLRKALGESPQDHQYILTVPGRGYRFAENVRLVPDQEVSIVAAQHSKVEVQVKETKPWGWLSAAVILVLAIAGGTTWLLLHRKPVLTEKDPVVLADFANSTGDPVFDGTLRQGLAIQLEQSPFLKIMNDTQLQRDLRLMNLQPGARITNQIAHDVCVREGAAATIEGAIASLGKSYVITLEAITCQEGATLAREQIQAEDKEHVLNALGTAATTIRGKLGESLSSIEKLNRPLEQVTTASLEALQNYTEGLSVMGPGHFLAAVPLFERAIAIDPKFAMAYYLLGIAVEQAGDMARSAEYAKQAFLLIDRVSDYERTGITAYYYRATGELDKEIDAYQLGVRYYPRNWGFHNQLSLIYIDEGRYEEGLKEGLEAVRLEADVEPPCRRILDSYICVNRLQEARQVAEKVRALGIMDRGFINASSN
jgi:eukaryotic-like serine/threonine-protein kinase